MRILPWTTFAAVIVGDDLHGALVSGSLLGARSRSGPVLRGFLQMPADEARRALREVPPAAEILLVVPGSMVGVRPTALPASKWLAARGEIQRSIESLFPIRADDAAVGFVGRRQPEGGEAGYLVAADRGALKPWIEGLGRALGRSVDRVVSSHMALPGLGLQQEAESAVLDPVTGAWHRLERGEITELNGAPGEGARAAAVLPGAQADSPAGRQVSGIDLAVAAAVAPAVAPARIAPMIGREFAPARRWIPVAAAVAGAAALLWLATWTEGARYERAIARMEDERISRSALLAEAVSARQRALDLGARLAAVAAARGEAGTGMMPAIDAAQAVIPAKGFIYRLDLDGRTITVKGEAARAGDVLRALEDAAEFHGARELDTPMTVEERGLEMFNIRADRVAPAAAKGGNP